MSIDGSHECRCGRKCDGDRAAQDIMAERRRQVEKWGVSDHDPFLYLNILIEEVGEFAQASLQTRFGGPKGGHDHMREEAVQVAAVALAIVECLDRGKWEWPTSA
jgi:NTP pyrophosphatase (non-canonical NTP hydrolase)